MKKQTIAICYDFDKTLSPKNMQEFGFFEQFKIVANDFWNDKNEVIKANNADSILINMYEILNLAKNNGIKLTKEALMEYGRTIKLYSGVETWFERINAYGESLNVNIEHFIISSGHKEMIEGTDIAKFFKKIYACSYFYNADGEAVWPAVAVNYTNKTQFLFRINKGCLEEYDDNVNSLMPHEDRAVSFDNMIYIGDSATDIPCMRVVMKNGGNSIGVYDTEEKKKELKTLLNNNKINFIAKADYSKGKDLEVIIKNIIKNNKIKHSLKELAKAQKV